MLVDQIGGYRLGFPGQSLDAESGLWHNGFRDYEASLGRYIQSDPIGLEGGVNTYGYALANPAHFTDAHGLKASAADCAKRCAADVLGLEDLVDVGLIVSGQTMSEKPFNVEGTVRGTSPAARASDAVFGRARLPWRLPTIVGGPGTGSRLKISFTKSVARFVGRGVPVVGWGMLAYDGYKFSTCMYECTQEGCGS